MKHEHPGYRARNMDVTAAYGLNAGLCSIKKRMRQRKDCPLWLIKKLDEVITRSNQLIEPLIRHRDELPSTIE